MSPRQAALLRPLNRYQQHLLSQCVLYEYWRETETLLSFSGRYYSNTALPRGASRRADPSARPPRQQSRPAPGPVRLAPATQLAPVRGASARSPCGGALTSHILPSSRVARQSSGNVARLGDIIGPCPSMPAARFRGFWSTWAGMGLPVWSGPWSSCPTLRAASLTGGIGTFNGLHGQVSDTELSRLAGSGRLGKKCCAVADRRTVAGARGTTFSLS